jgi:PIN domain nuclease of toxin-antitoxin system
MRLLLDTCTFLWVILGAEELTPRVRALVTDSANEVFLSAVSAWEIAVKHRLGRLRLPQPPERFVPAQRDAHGLAPLPLDEEAALHLTRLPLLHRDPFDRMLVCQALVHGLAILTPDPLINQYPARVVW